MPPSSPSKILTNTAVRFLSLRPRFKAEVESKLLIKAKEINADPTLINQIIKSLIKSGFINDKELLKSYIHHRLIERGKGPFWIRMRLVRLGLNKQEIENAIKKHAPRKLQVRVLRQIVQKNQLKKSDLMAKARLMRRLLSRGFGIDLVRQAVDSGPSWE
ncbi:RecX family transcriptional regulator [Candidatus Collierbacteria bacterium]|nr:RecX family transcriptional regulator [Candidatus Collierbacteria bacterium]